MITLPALADDSDSPQFLLVHDTTGAPAITGRIQLLVFGKKQHIALFFIWKQHPAGVQENARHSQKKR